MFMIKKNLYGKKLKVSRLIFLLPADFGGFYNIVCRFKIKAAGVGYGQIQSTGDNHPGCK